MDKPEMEIQEPMIEELEARFEMTTINATPAAPHPQPDTTCVGIACCPK